MIQLQSSYFWVVLLSATAAVAITAAWRLTDRRVQGLWWIYISAYFGTTFVGGLLIGLFGVDYFESMSNGINIGLLTDTGSSKYWVLLFGPLILPPLCIVLFGPSTKTKRATTSPSRPKRRARIDIASFSLVLLFFAGYNLWELYTNGLLNAINLWQIEQGNFHTFMALRSDTFQSLGQGYFIIAYTVIPTLSLVALHETVRTRQLVWLLAFGITIVLTLYFNLSTFQKAYILISFLSIGIGLVTLRVIKLRSFGMFVVGSFVLLTFMQTFLIGHWQLLDSVRHLVFRMSSAYPFYLNVFPTHLPYEGIYLGLNCIGVGESSQISANVMHYMYTNLGEGLAHAPAAAHIDAYAQGGVVYSLAMLVVIGVFLAKISTFRLEQRGPIGFALYIQLYAFAYYLTQVSFVTSIVGSYGIAWPLVAIAPLWLAGKFVSNYARPRQIGMRTGVTRALPQLSR